MRDLSSPVLVLVLVLYPLPLPVVSLRACKDGTDMGGGTVVVVVLLMFPIFGYYIFNLKDSCVLN